MSTGDILVVKADTNLHHCLFAVHIIEVIEKMSYKSLFTVDNVRPHH